MADNVTLSAGAGGDTAAADDVGGVKHQRVKLSVGADGSASDAIPVSDGLDTTAAGVQAVGLCAQLDDVATGTVTENQFTSLRLSSRRALLVEGVASGTAVPVSGTVTANIGTVSTLATAAKQDTGNTSLGSIDTSTTTVAALSKAEDSAHSSGHTGILALGVRNATVTDLSAGNTDGDYEPFQVNASGRVYTSATIDAAIPAGTNGIGKLTANSGVTIGAVEVAAAQTLATVTTVSTVTAVTTLTGGGVAHAAADSGNPVKVGAKALASPKGVTLAADGNRTDARSDLDGFLLVRGQTALADLISTSQSVTDTTSTALTNFSAVASTHNYVSAITVHNAHATTNGYVKLQDGSGGTTIWVLPAPATGGTTHNFDPPLRQPTANTALYFASSASITTIYVSVTGFQSKV